MKQFEVFHILVNHKYEAEDILKKINQGLSFSEAAKKYSLCSSKVNGGALGLFKPRRFVDSFEEAFESLAENKISSPVRTQFGYHLIFKKCVTL